MRYEGASRSCGSDNREVDPVTVYLQRLSQGVPRSTYWAHRSVLDTVGYKRASSIDTPGCRISSRSYSRQYESVLSGKDFVGSSYLFTSGEERLDLV